MKETFLSGAEFDLPLYEHKLRGAYIICSTPRSGSTLLCALLKNTGVMGVPHEYFHLTEHAQILWKRLVPDAKSEITIVEYFNAMVRHRTSENGIFGLKAHINQCFPYYQNGFMSHFFGDIKHVAIRRRDTLGQAISSVIASQTGKWTSEEKASKAAEFAPELIEGALTTILYQNHLWQHFFQLNAIQPCVCYYEDLLENPSNEIQRILDFVGVESNIPVDIEKAGIRKEATQLNEDWRRRFNAAFKMPRRNSSGQ